MTARAVTEADLGAWLFKHDARANPALLGPDAEPITSRCVTRGYRAALMKPGDPVLLWVSGDGRRLARGIWGVGRVTGPAHEDGGQLAVPVSFTLRRAAVSDSDLRGSGIDDLEVQRMPAGSNPSYVSRRQWERIAPLLDEDGEKHLPVRTTGPRS